MKLIRRVGSDKYRNVLVECECSCGKTVVIRRSHFERGEITSCGCRAEMSAKLVIASTKHGQCFSPTYESWTAMKQRCLYAKHPAYKHYGGRGITVCKQWIDSFEQFHSDMGTRPEGMELERKNTNGDYEPSNCKWATPKENCRNRRNNHLIEVNGETHCISEWSEKTGIKKTTISERLQRGWSPERAVS